MDAAADAPAGDRWASLVRWAAGEMDARYTAYSAAQKILEVTDDEPTTFSEQPGLEALQVLVARYESGERAEATQAIRRLLHELSKA